MTARREYAGRWLTLLFGVGLGALLADQLPRRDDGSAVPVVEKRIEGPSIDWRTMRRDLLICSAVDLGKQGWSFWIGTREEAAGYLDLADCVPAAGKTPAFVHPVRPWVNGDPDV